MPSTLTATLIITSVLVAGLLTLFLYQQRQETLNGWAPWPSYEICDKPIAYQFP